MRPCSQHKRLGAATVGGAVHREAMTLGPMNVYDTAPVWHQQFKQGAAAYPLTGLQPSAIKIHFSQRGTRVHKFGRGTIVITDAANGLYDYYWNAVDTSTPGIWDIWAELTIAPGQTLSSINTEPLTITNRVRGYSKFGMGRLALSAPAPQ